MKRQHRQQKQKNLKLEQLEGRRLMAASMGWDGPGQGSAELTYHIANSPSSLSEAETVAAIEKALNVWAEVAQVTFTRTDQPGQRDSLDISFASMDGPGGALAQAYFPDDVNSPIIAGDIQFDSAETWEVGNALGHRAFDLLWVAVHEIGHSLGLGHSSDHDSVLADSVSPNQEFVALDQSDVEAIQRLYAAVDPAATPPTNEPPTNEPPTNDDHHNEDHHPDDDDSFWTAEFFFEPSDSTVEFWFTGNWWDLGQFWSGPWSESNWWWGEQTESIAPDNHNLYSGTDVNDDGVESALDALIVINYLDDPSGTGYVDVNADGNVSAIDALITINSLHQNRQPVAAESKAPAHHSDFVGRAVNTSHSQRVSQLDDFFGALGKPLG